MVVKWRHCYVKVTSSCEIASKCIQWLLEAYFKIEKQWWARKRIQYSCEGRVENPSLGITVCHHSWCQTAILGTDFSIISLHSWYILIILTEVNVIFAGVYHILYTSWKVHYCMFYRVKYSLFHFCCTTPLGVIRGWDQMYYDQSIKKNQNNIYARQIAPDWYRFHKACTLETHIIIQSYTLYL